MIQLLQDLRDKDFVLIDTSNFHTSAWCISPQDTVATFDCTGSFPDHTAFDPASNYTILCEVEIFSDLCILYPEYFI